ncbi:MAG TPA: rhodanese-related sulfurtransferase [Chitinophagaceae bacterium]|nr:rhodanese-related sulfurtransferase [Chitinophagaceae bacterium]
MPLHNRVSRRELRDRIAQDPTPRTTISFYRYFPVSDPELFRNELYRHFSRIGVLGRIYVAHEGINAQVSVPVAQVDAFTQYLYSTPGLDQTRLNRAVDDNASSFYVLDIKVRKKIVADGITDPAFDMSRCGRYVDAEEFNRLTESPDTVVVDMRNHYEYEVGHFENALEVPSDTFREQLPMAAEMLDGHREKTIIMYCTGGIRCEKASAYLLHRGFQNVFHLEGGIIQYVNEVREKGIPNKFHGKNFVFDQRLGERVTDEVIASCHQCGRAADTHVNCANDACHLLFIQCEDCRGRFEGCCSDECREFIHLPAEEQRRRRAGLDRGRNVFNKARAAMRKKLK